jgi:hypothetical protein
VPSTLKGEFTAVPRFDAGPFKVTLQKTAFTVK